MTFTHLETMNPFATHSRKTQRVYKSPADANEPSPFQKEKNKPLDIDAEDEEAGTILMSLAQHANRIHTTYDEKVSFLFGLCNSLFIFLNIACKK